MLKNLLMHKISILFLWSLGLLLGAMSCIKEPKPDEPASKVAVGDLVPEITVDFVDGTRLSTTALQGRVLVITFFDTRCGDCQRFLPSLDSLYRAAKGEAAFLTIAREQTASQVASYWASKGYALPYAAPGHRGLYHLFATRTIPRVYVVSRKGSIVAMYDDENMPAMAEMHRVILSKAQ